MTPGSWTDLKNKHMRRILTGKIIRWALLTGIFFLILMIILRITFAYHFKAPGSSLTDFFPAYGLGLRFDLRVVCILILVMWLLGSLPFFNPYRSTAAKKIWNVVLIITGLTMMIFYVADFAHYAYLKQRLNASAINYLQDAVISAQMVWQTYPVLRTLLTMLLMIWFISIVFKKIWEAADGPSILISTTRKIVTGILVFFLMALGIFGKAGQYPLRWSDAFTLGDSFSNNLSLNPFQSFFSTLKMRNSTTVDLEQTKKYFPVIANYLGIERNQPLNYERPVNGIDSLSQLQTNVVLVICESFSAYKSSMWGNPLNTTPYFNQLCNEGVFFSRFFTPAYGTAKGVWATITGIPDVTTSKTASRNMAMVSQHTIINEFKNHEKLYFLGGSTSWANIRGLLVNNIDGLRLYEEGSFKSPQIDVWGISDKNLFLESHEILKKQARPFFAIIQTAGNHRPYTIPSEDLVEFKRVEFPEDSLRNNGFDNNDELNAFRYSDYCIQKFMEAARTEPYFKKTLFVFIGDHGILGKPGPPFNNTWTEGDLTREHVPLLFYAPGLLQSKRYSAVCSQVDLLPTIASITGIEYKNTTIGRNILLPDHLKDSSLLTQSAFRFNAESNLASLVMNEYYYELQLGDGKDRLLYMESNNPVPVNDQTEQVKAKARELTKAILETSRYMLLNNKKK
jgi:glucan phosphoethanolaminetransferase (alkaline phosphatase superfamily)